MKSAKNSDSVDPWRKQTAGIDPMPLPAWDTPAAISEIRPVHCEPRVAHGSIPFNGVRRDFDLSSRISRKIAITSDYFLIVVPPPQVYTAGYTHTFFLQTIIMVNAI